jgi:hypothetical protein
MSPETSPWKEIVTRTGKAFAELLEYSHMGSQLSLSRTLQETADKKFRDMPQKSGQCNQKSVLDHRGQQCDRSARSFVKREQRLHFSVQAIVAAWI